ncbi:MAG: GNAT family N-acetyltransferase [Lachnospiraceae bacterium]|nr:GNAT family N-acetyltransferase [Lachnospiraceae bacterium]
MILTGIGNENAKAFSHLFGGLDYKNFTLCVGAIEEDRAAGAAFFSEMGDSLFLDYIYVLPEFRRRGIATALLEETIEALKGLDLVALHVNYPEKADDIHQFIEARGFRIFRDGKAFWVKARDLIDSQAAKKLLSGKPRHRISEVSALTALEKKALKKSLKQNELDPKIVDDRSYDKELSLVTIDKKSGMPAGMVLCRLNEDTIVLSYLVNFSNDPVMLLNILIALKDRVVEKGLADFDLIFLTMTDDMVRLPEKLLRSKELLKEDGNVISGIRMFTKQWADIE